MKFVADEIFKDCSQNRQSAKINSLPKFPAILYWFVNLIPIPSHVQAGMKVIRHAGVDSRMIVLDNQATIGSDKSFVSVLDRPK